MLLAAYMHVDHLPIPLGPANNSCHQNQSIPADEIPNASFVSRVMACVCLQVEFQRQGERHKGKIKEQAGDYL